VWQLLERNHESRPFGTNTDDFVLNSQIIQDRSAILPDLLWTESVLPILQEIALHWGHECANMSRIAGRPQWCLEYRLWHVN
jgi:hypothetical protein